MWRIGIEKSKIIILNMLWGVSWKENRSKWIEFKEISIKVEDTTGNKRQEYKSFARDAIGEDRRHFGLDERM